MNVISLSVFVWILFIQSVDCHKFCEQRNFDSIIKQNIKVTKNYPLMYRFFNAFNQTHYEYWPFTSLPKYYTIKQKHFFKKNESEFGDYYMPYQTIEVGDIPQCVDHRKQCKDVMALNAITLNIYRSQTYDYYQFWNKPNAVLSSKFIHTILSQKHKYRPLVYWPKKFYFFGIMDDNNGNKTILKLEIMAFDNEVKLSDGTVHVIKGFENMVFTSAFVWFKTDTIHVVVEDVTVPEDQSYGYVYEFNDIDMTFTSKNQTVVQFFGCKTDSNETETNVMSTESVTTEITKESNVIQYNTSEDKVWLTETHLVSTQSELVSTESELVSTESELVSTQSELVSTESESIDSLVYIIISLLLCCFTLALILILIVTYMKNRINNSSSVRARNVSSKQKFLSMQTNDSETE